jgi:hypothetical protein
MRNHILAIALPVLAIPLLAVSLQAPQLQAQSFTTTACGDDQGNTSNNSLFGNKSKLCELRRATLPLINGQLNVSAKNGGIEVIGEDRTDIDLEARVVVQESSTKEAQSLLKEIKILTDGSIRAEGPSSGMLAGLFGGTWYVNFRLHVPRHLAADLHSENGGIDLSNIEGEIRARTTNGGLTLRDLGGKVHAVTVNGGLDIALNGAHWHGDGLYAQSTNGGVHIKAPDHYSAHLIASTTNGGISVAFPVTVQGSIKNYLDTQIGQGGPTIQVQTTNGGVEINHD